MKIYTTFDSDRADILRIWARSWEQQGWSAHILRDDRRGKLVCDCCLINFSLSNPRKKPRRLYWKKFGEPGWKEAPLVLFPDYMTELEILECGRSLNAPAN